MSSLLCKQPIYLVGMMGAGKSVVGTRLAKRLGVPFFDLDHWVEQKVGLTIPLMFSTGREARFRGLEEQGVIDLGGKPCVIATGGGAVKSVKSLEHMLTRGRVVYLRAGVAAILARMSERSIATRPLLRDGDPQKVLEELLRERSAAYERAHVVIDTDGMPRDEVAAHVARVLAAAMVPVPVPESEGGRYDALIARDDPNGEILRAHTAGWLGKRPRFLLADRDVAARYGARVARALGDCPIVTVTPGEACKSFTEMERVASELVQLGVDRSSVLFALGGGALGDLAGFIAATLLRGMDYVHLPTTLMAMVDSSIGGKTAVNLPIGKNLVGAFHQPRLVLSDLSTLATLNARDRTAGLGEVLKHALLAGEDPVAAIERDADRLRDGSPESLLEVVTAAVAFKAGVVAADPREKKRAQRMEQASGRITLNLGHTIAHGLETASHHTDDPLRHGEAVLLGLWAESIVGASFGLWPEGPARLAALLPRLGLASALEGVRDRLRADPAQRDVVKAAMVADKKKESGGLRFVFVSDGPGHCSEMLLDANHALEIWLGENVG